MPVTKIGNIASMLMNSVSPILDMDYGMSRYLARGRSHGTKTHMLVRKRSCIVGLSKRRQVKVDWY